MDERAALKTIGNAIKHRRYVLLAIVVACTLAAGVASIVRPPTYQGTALLFVDERFNSSQGFDLALQAGQLLSAHFIQAATSQPVLERACSGAYFNTPDTQHLSCTFRTLGPQVSATTVRGTDWIGVSVNSRSAADSAALANAVAGAMLDQNKADIHQLLLPTQTYLDAELKRLGALIAAEEVKIDALQQGTAPGQSAAIAGEQAQLALLQSQYSNTYAQSQSLVIEENRLAGSLTLVQQAAVPAKPIDPDPLRYVAAGLVAGLCLGLVAVVLVDRYDDRVFESEALAQAAGTRLVVAVSHKESTTSSAQASRAYSLARASVLAQHPNMRKLLLVAASSRDRVRPIAAGLGMAAVKAGQKVMVVDAEANSYVMQQQNGKNGSLMTIVSAPADGEGVVHDVAIDGDGKYELTIISTPSPDRHPAAIIAARTADVAIVVATAGSTHYSDVRRTAETLRLAGIQVVASVFAHGVPESRPDPEPAPTDLYEVAVNQWRLPTWRGPGGS
jgi:capsular polysaccharide biosynthesis protein